MRNLFRLLMGVVCAGTFAPKHTRAADPAGARPNVIIILADDLGYADVGFNGCKDIPTPHIDSLAQSGVRFANGYVTHSYCSPSRAALLTGRYQHRFGHDTNPEYEPESNKLGLPVGQVTIADVMKKAGYVTGAVGKWHLGAAPCFHPNQRGFDEFFGFLGGGHQYLNWKPGKPEYIIPLQRNETVVDEKEYLTDAFSREAVSFVERHKDKAFFLYLAYNAVHGPFQAPQKYLDRFSNVTDERRRAYCAMTSALDDGVGLLMRKLRELKVEENTLVFFLSDNGGPPPDASPASNAPLRGHKGTFFEGGVRVPFVASWQGKLKVGVACEAPISSLDLFPTAAAAAGAEVPASLQLDGADILPYLTQASDKPPHEQLYWRSVRMGTWAVREGNWKLVHERRDSTMLFDLSADMVESNDLATKYPEIIKRLSEEYASWNKQNVPPLWGPPEMARPTSRPASRPQVRKAARTG